MLELLEIEGKALPRSEHRSRNKSGKGRKFARAKIKRNKTKRKG